VIVYTILICILVAVTCQAVARSRGIGVLLSVVLGVGAALGFFLLLGHRDVLETENIVLIAVISCAATGIVAFVLRTAFSAPK
jgi:hypothetical protein